MILDLPYILETRRNHALEHATLHLLASAPRKHKSSMAGHSNPTGFFLFGNLEIEEVRFAVTAALTRLRSGESTLAIHDGCGTNLVTTALLSGTLAWSVLRGAKSTLIRLLLLPIAVLLAMLGFFLAKPLGPFLQQYTTEASMGDLQIIDIIRVRHGVHRIITA